jgi:hypothetical protein
LLFVFSNYVLFVLCFCAFGLHTISEVFELRAETDEAADVWVRAIENAAGLGL